MCAVLHGPDECCHYGDTRLVEPKPIHTLFGVSNTDGTGAILYSDGVFVVSEAGVEW